MKKLEGCTNSTHVNSRLKSMLSIENWSLRWPTRDTLQTKNEHCKQKRCAANKKRTLQTKKGNRCKQKRLVRCKQKDELPTKE